MADNRSIKYTATLDDTPFAAGSARLGGIMDGMRGRFATSAQGMRSQMDAVKAHVNQAVKGIAGDMTAMGGHFSGVLEAVGNTRLGVVALVGAFVGMAAVKTVGATAKMTEEAMDLGRVLGSTTNIAQEWKVALEDVGGTQGDLEGAAKGLSRQLKENEADLQAMGLQTRDAAGNFRPMNDLLLDGIGILNDHKEGADRALAAQTLFGRGVDASSKLLLINQDTMASARDTVADLGLEVGENAVKAWGEFDGASDRAGFTLKAVSKVIGSILMPVVTDVINAFNRAMPYAIVVLRGALGGLATAFHLVKNGVVVLWEVINAFVVSVAEPIRAVGEAVGRALVGDFTGAADVIKNVPTVIKGAWSNAMQNMVESSTQARERIAAIWSPDTTAGIPDGAVGGKSYVPPPDNKTTRTTKTTPAATVADPSRMREYEALLSSEKLLVTQKDALREYTKEQEAEFWRGILKLADVSEKDRFAITKKVADLEVQLLRDAAKQRQSIDAEVRAGAEQRALEAVELARTEAQTQADLGNITAKQLLEQERAFEEQRNEIRRTYLQARLALIDPDRNPVEYARVSNDIANLEAQHQQRLAQIRGSLAKDAQNNSMATIFEGIGQAMQKSIDGIIGRTQTMRTALTSLWQGTRSAITGELSKIIQAKIAAFARERLLMLAGIGGKAAEAGAGAAASQAAIPIVGPAMAMASMAAIMASVLGLSGKVPSARGGFDIPFGSNPMTQLHEQEMVLPKEQADVIRGMAGGGGGGSPINLSVSALDTRGFEDWLNRGGGDTLVKHLQRQRRNFNSF